MPHETLRQLRQRAEAVLHGGPARATGEDSQEVSRLFHELQVYQLELEMQVEELRNVSAELDLQKQRFEHLYNAAPIGYLVVNKLGVILNANPMAVQLLRRDKHMLLSKPLSGFIHSSDIQHFYLFLRQMMKLPGQQQCTVRLKSGADDFLDVQLSAVCTEVDTGDPYSYITLTDITEHLQDRQKLREAHHRLELALEASSTGIWEIDSATGRIVLDDNAYSILGLRPFDFKGTMSALLELVHADDRERFAKELRQSVASGAAFNLVFRGKSSSHPLRFFQARGKKTVHDAHRYTGTLTDITERIRLEDESRQLLERQQQALASAAFEGEENEKKRVSESLHNGVGQLLYGLKLGLEPLKVDYPQAYQQLNELVTDAIRDVRNISHELAPNTLAEFGLKAALEEMSGRFGPHVSFRLHIEETSRQFDISVRLCIFRIVQELVNNAIRHGQAAMIDISIRQTQREIMLTVMDNGKGFDIKRIAVQKSGNGLSGIRNRLGIYNGSLQINSRPNKGTVIEVRLKQKEI